jgi:CheY-like chemotaxis protein
MDTVEWQEEEFDGYRCGRRPERPGPVLVLVVDDCPLQRMLACKLLLNWSIVPVLASDGVEAVLLAGELELDIILMDVQMPVLDGLMATLRIRQQEQIRQAPTAVPVVAHTAGGMSADSKLLSRCGMNALLRKPCTAPEMESCLSRWCPDKFPMARVQGSTYRQARSSGQLQRAEEAPFRR